MSDPETPIAWLALQEGASIIASDGTDVGKVITVVADREKDIFSGVSFRTGLLDAERFVPADQIAEITTGGVHLTIDSAAVDSLEPYEA
jgi:hypothetical protein